MAGSAGTRHPKAILGEEDPFDPIALPPSFMPPKLPGSSIDPEARPTFAEACAVLRGRLAAVTTYADTLTEDEPRAPDKCRLSTRPANVDIDRSR